jgi:4-hydroxy-3-methylbut-2-enyl diphosphate reductase
VANVTVRDPSKVVWLSQTTLSVDETHADRRPAARAVPDAGDPPSDDICYATQNRQVAVKAMASACDLVIVVGSQKLVELAAPGRGGADRRRAGLVTWWTSPARSTSPGSTACARSA